MKKKICLCQWKYVILLIHVLLGLNFNFFVKINVFLVKNAFLTVSDTIIREKSKILLKGFSMD